MATMMRKLPMAGGMGAAVVARRPDPQPTMAPAPLATKKPMPLPGAPAPVAQPQVTPLAQAPVMNTGPQPATMTSGPMPPLDTTGSVGGINPVAGASVNRINPANDMRFTSIAPDGSGPDRTALAQKTFADLMAGHTDDYRLGVEGVGRDAARLGRIGMGGVATSVGNLRDTLERRKFEAGNALASSVAEGDISDRRSNRNELRTERDYQYGAGNDAMDREIQRRAFEDALQNSEFNRNVTRTQLGYQGSPSQTQIGVGESIGEDAAGSVEQMQLLLQEMARRRQQGGTAAPGGITYSGGLGNV
jgi:hypothetical protein